MVFLNFIFVWCVRVVCSGIRQLEYFHIYHENRIYTERAFTRNKIQPNIPTHQ